MRIHFELAGLEPPTIVIQAADVALAPFPGHHDPYVLVVLNDIESAQEWHERIVGQLTRRESRLKAGRIGHALLLRNFDPEDAEHWEDGTDVDEPVLDDLWDEGARVYVKSQVDVSVRFGDAEALKRLEERIKMYFALPSSLLARPPWSTDGLTDDEQAARRIVHDVIQESEASVRDAIPDLMSVPDLEELEAASGADLAKKRAAVLRHLQAQQTIREAVAGAAEINKSGTPLEAEVRTTYAAFMQEVGNPDIWGRLAQLVGASPTISGQGGAALMSGGRKPDPAKPREGGEGTCRIEGDELQLGALTFASLPDGLPALMEHLWSLGGTELRIAFTGA